MSCTQFRHGMLAMILWALMGGMALADSGWFWQNPLPQAIIYGVLRCLTPIPLLR